MGFREVSVVEIREVLRAWLEGAALRTAAERAGVDRKTARRCVQAAEDAGLDRAADQDAVTDELVGAVVATVRPSRPNGLGAARKVLVAHEEQIRMWITAEAGRKSLLPKARCRISRKAAVGLARRSFPSGCPSLPSVASFRSVSTSWRG